MKTKLLLLAVCCALFAGCEKKAPELKELPDELAKLPQGTQIALVMETPATIFAWAAVAWALNGGAIYKKIVRHKTAKAEEKK